MQPTCRRRSTLQGRDEASLGGIQNKAATRGTTSRFSRRATAGRVVGVQSVVAVVARDPETCFRAFIDASTFPAWIPGLRRAQVVQSDASGRATEIMFEFGASRTYSLAYSYDLARREVKWEPRSNKRDAVAGSATFEAADEGTRITYSNAPHAGEMSREELDDLLASFIAYLPRRR